MTKSPHVDIRNVTVNIKRRVIICFIGGIDEIYFGRNIDICLMEFILPVSHKYI